MINVFSQAKERAFEALFNLLPINFSWIDTQGYILECNERVLSHQEMNKFNEIIGKHTSEVCSEGTWENTKKVIETGESIIFEETHVKKDGSTIYFLSIKSPVKSQDGTVIGVVNIAIDITDRKMMEFELEESKKAAQLADNAKTEFLNNMRHDLRTPFSGIIGSAEILESKEKDNSKKQILRDIIDSADSVLNHLNGILDCVKIEKGPLPVIQKAFDMHGMLEDIYKMMLPSAKQKNIEFGFSIDKTIPSYLIGDITRTQKILMNIIANAIKFTEKGHVHISVGWKEKSNHGCITQFIVEDTGIGIPDDKKEAIFEKFYRLSPSYDGRYVGTGLGLHMVKEFLEEIDGQYDIKSEEGKGTIFKIFVPYKIPLMENVINSYGNRSIGKKLAS